VRGGAVLFFLLFVLAVTWPGMVLFNRVRPLILGIPFSMAWIALWVAASFLVLLAVEWTEEEEEEEDEAGRAPGPRPGAGPGRV
jgi:hypothetical protein